MPTLSIKFRLAWARKLVPYKKHIAFLEAVNKVTKDRLKNMPLFICDGTISDRNAPAFLCAVAPIHDLDLYERICLDAVNMIYNRGFTDHKHPMACELSHSEDVRYFTHLEFEKNPDYFEKTFNYLFVEMLPSIHEMRAELNKMGMNMEVFFKNQPNFGPFLMLGISAKDGVTPLRTLLKTHTLQSSDPSPA